MNATVFDSLAPVVLLIASGVLAGRCGWLGQDSVKHLTQLIFYVLSPALLFRTMSQVHIEQLAVSQSAELGDLPLSIFRISAVGRMSQLSVRLEADFAVDACDQVEDKEEDEEKDKDKLENQVITCIPRIRRIAWRRLEN